jgi:hypothetical protein
MKKFLAHPLTQKTRRILRRVVVVTAVILAVAFVLTLSVDLGPAVREQAERGASAFLERPVHIGRMSVRLWNGKYVLEDFVIDGLTSESPPFLHAKRIAVSMLWNTLADRRVVFDDIEMTDWKMFVENRRDGRNSFPRFNRGGGGERRWTVTMQYVRAHRGEFVYDDQTTPWSVITRNLDVTVARPSTRYVGTARFSNGTVKIQDYLPFRADMDSRFTIDGGRVVLDPINLTTDGTRSVLKGDVNLSYWPEQMYSVRSEIDLPRMREIFFADDEFSLSGTGHFDGVFHLFKDFRPDGTQRTGRELKGTFTSDIAGVNSLRFEDLDGIVRWVPESLTFTEATTRLLGGTARLDYRMSPLGHPETKPTHRFAAFYDNIDLTTFAEFMEMQGLRPAGRASGRNLLEWPSGDFAARHGDGEVRVIPPAGVTLMTRAGRADEASRTRADGPVSPRPSLTPPAPLSLAQPVPIGGAIVYTYGPDTFDLAPSQFATESTLVEFRGRTFNGDRSNIPFHVSSADWQESDRLLAGLMTAFGNPTRPIAIGGSGTFDGLMSGAFRTPRIEGTFDGERIQAFDVVWGAVTGDVVIENSYADARNVVIMSGASTIRTDGRYSIGYPRRDGGEQINAHVAIERRPVSDLRYAFELDEYNLDGTLSGDFTLKGDYTAPFGSGTMRIEQGVAYGEPFEEATAGIVLEGNGVRLNDIRMRMAGATGEGAAFIGWNGTYSFDFGADSIEIERLAVTQGSTLPLSGLLDFTATGSGTFDAPRYEVRGRMRDVFVGDEGVGEIVGTLSMVDGARMNVKLDASSTRLAVSASGAIAVTPDMDAELTFVVTETSLDPYIRVFQPRLSPFTTAVASGTIKVTGKLADIDQLVVDTTVDTLALRLFDYQLRNPENLPIRMALDSHAVQIRELRLVGQDTDFNLTGTVGLHDEPSTPADERRIALVAEGNANLSILQGFFRNVQSRGRAGLQARLEGPLDDPVVIGRMTMENGRIRHFGFPHALDGVAGVLSFDTRGVRLDEVSARLGQGTVQFGGTVGIAEYRLGSVDVTMSGRDMQLRDFPEGMRSRVDADLEVQGTSAGLTVTGNVRVLDARYAGDFDTAGMFGGGNGGGLPVVASYTAPVIPIQYDVRITAMSTLQVNNDLMRNIEGSADLRLAGTYDRPLLFGRVDIEDGEINYDAKRYVIRRGTIDFNNPTRIVPFLDVETEARVRVPGETYRVTVRATGLLPEPTLSFSSEPPLPEDEILALLAADVAPGRDVEARRYAAVTPQEQLLREQFARSIAGLATGEVSRAVEEAIGVDFRVTPTITNTNPASTSVDPGLRFVIARQQGPVYFTYSRSTSATRDQLIQVEISQTDDISWILSRNEDGTYALDVQFRRTF